MAAFARAILFLFASALTEAQEIQATWFQHHTQLLPISIVLNNPSLNSSFCLDLFGRQTDNGSLIDVWQCDGTQGQLWIFEPGSYRIRSSISSKKCIDATDMNIGTQLKIWDCNDLPQQKFGWDADSGAIYLGSGAKTSSSKCIESTAHTHNGTAVLIANCSNSTNQSWRVNQAPGPVEPNATFFIKHGPMCMDVLGQQAVNGNPIDLWACNGLKGQQWVFAAGTYRIRSLLDPSKCVDALGMQPGSDHLVLWDCNGLPQQRWGYNGASSTIYLDGQTSCMKADDSQKNGTYIGIGDCSSQWNLEKVNDTASTSSLMDAVLV